MIEVEGLSKRFGKTQAVAGLSFRVEPGTITGFLGPNGAGKSTTLRSVLGLVHPDAGSATVLGVPYRGSTGRCTESAPCSRRARCIRAAPGETICECRRPRPACPRRGSTRCSRSSS